MGTSFLIKGSDYYYLTLPRRQLSETAVYLHPTPTQTLKSSKIQLVSVAHLPRPSYYPTPGWGYRALIVGTSALLVGSWRVWVHTSSQVHAQILFGSPGIEWLAPDHPQTPCWAADSPIARSESSTNLNGGGLLGGVPYIHKTFGFLVGNIVEDSLHSPYITYSLSPY